MQGKADLVRLTQCLGIQTARADIEVVEPSAAC